MSEYNNYTTGGPSCSYADLANYNAGYSMNIAPQGKVISGKYIVPTWSAISYKSLENDVPTGSGYFNVTSAYGSDAGNCQTTYRTSLCGNRK